MFLSRIRLRPDASDDPGFWASFSDAYRVHRAVWDLFADHPDRRRDFLYRMDNDLGRPRILVLSEREPNDRSGIWRIETKIFEPVLREGDRLGFLVRVNPTVRRDGKRHDVVMNAKHEGYEGEASERIQDAIGEWIRKRADRGGFELGSSWVEGHRVMEFRKSSGRRVRIAVADIRGELLVRDVEAFREVLLQGLGPAKSFGCGLLLIRRA